ncbi:MAG: hypothetical protein AB7I13_00050 [Vicinamibacterales bacterium]
MARRRVELTEPQAYLLLVVVFVVAQLIVHFCDRVVDAMAR